MTLSIIVAVAANNAIGKDNDLLWHLPGDLKRFKETTTGHTIIMGKNTFHSLPNGALPNRRNIVVSSTLVPPDGVECYSTLQAALEAVAGEEEVFIIGGAQLYAAALPLADKIYFSRVEKGFPEADTYFPEFDLTEWTPSYCTRYPEDERNEYAVTLTIYQRIAYFKHRLK